MAKDKEPVCVLPAFGQAFIGICLTPSYLSRGAPPGSASVVAARSANMAQHLWYQCGQITLHFNHLPRVNIEWEIQRHNKSQALNLVLRLSVEVELGLAASM